MLLVQYDQNWALPHFAFTEDHFGTVDHVSRAALERLGLSVTVFHCLLDWGSSVAPSWKGMPFHGRNSAPSCRRWKPPR